MRNPKTAAGLIALGVLLLGLGILIGRMIPTVGEVRREMSLTPTPEPEGIEVSEGDAVSGDDGTGQDVSGEPGEGTTAGEEGEDTGSGEGTMTGSPMSPGEVPELPSDTPTPTPEPTPPTGWIEYDDDWWDAQMGESSGGYDDFYE